VNSGQYNQGLNAISIGNSAGFTGQGTYSLALGFNAGQFNQGTGCISLGNLAGNANQTINSIAIGTSAGNTGQGSSSIAIGNSTGLKNQGTTCVAIGTNAGQYNQGDYSIAIGSDTGNTGQGQQSICMGYQSGLYGIGANSIALGSKSGFTGTNPTLNTSTIILNATNSPVWSQASNAFYVAPIRNVVGTTYLQYNATTKEVTYSITAPSDERLKTEINDTSLGLDFVNKLHPVSFKWKNRLSQSLADTVNPKSPGVRVHEGFIAQEVKSVLDSLGIDSSIYVHTVDPDGPFDDIHGVVKDELIGPIVKAIQEQSAQIKSLQAQVTAMQQTLASLVPASTAPAQSSSPAQ
jgi:hypothetical protein